MSITMKHFETGEQYEIDASLGIKMLFPQYVFCFN